MSRRGRRSSREDAEEVWFDYMCRCGRPLDRAFYRPGGYEVLHELAGAGFARLRWKRSDTSGDGLYWRDAFENVDKSQPLSRVAGRNADDIVQSLFAANEGRDLVDDDSVEYVRRLSCGACPNEPLVRTAPLLRLLAEAWENGRRGKVGRTRL